MKIAYYFLFIVFAANISSGILTSWLGGQTEGDMGGIMPYDKTHTGPFLDEELQKEISAAGTTTTSGSTEDTTNILDLLGLGFIQKWIQTASSYLYGISSLMYSVFGDYMTSTQKNLWFGCEGGLDCEEEGQGINTGIIGIILTSMWVIAAIGLFTGKNLFED